MSSCLYPALPILVVDDEQAALTGFEIALASFGYTNVITMVDSRNVLPFLQNNKVEIILLDLIMPHMGGPDLLPRIKAEHPDTPVVIITAVSEIDSVVHCVQQGALDYILKPVDGKTLGSRMRKYLEMRDIERENQRLRATLLCKSTKRSEAFAEIVAENPAMLKIFQYCEAVAPSRRPVFISGETGTGKELIAKALHTLSGRSGEFVAINVAAFDDNMFTDALFGHVKGAFTGAHSDRRGLVATAWGGTLFLDEIGDLPMTSQVKLLRLLQEEEYLPLGSDMPQSSNVRVISSTLHHLQELKKEKKFREDLYFRFTTHHVHLPALRERLDDLHLLLNHFLRLESPASATPPEVSYELLELLKTYNFPGNIRELQSMVVDALANHEPGSVLSCATFRRHMQAEMEGALKNTGTANMTPGFQEAARVPRLKEAQAILTRTMIMRAMTLSGGNQTVAARHLGITQQALSMQLKKMPKSDDNNAF